MSGRKSKNKLLTLRLPEDHPVFNEENKTRVILDALNMYYAVKLYTEGKLDNEIKTVRKPDTTVKKEKLPVNMNPQQQRKFLEAFMKK